MKRYWYEYKYFKPTIHTSRLLVFARMSVNRRLHVHYQNDIDNHRFLDILPQPLFFGSLDLFVIAISFLVRVLLLCPILLLDQSYCWRTTLLCDIRSLCMLDTTSLSLSPCQKNWTWHRHNFMPSLFPKFSHSTTPDKRCFHWTVNTIRLTIPDLAVIIQLKSCDQGERDHVTMFM